MAALCAGVVIVVGAIAAGGFLGAQRADGRNDSSSSAGSSDSGEQVFRSRGCAACHQVQAEVIGPALAGPALFSLRARVLERLDEPSHRARFKELAPAAFEAVYAAEGDERFRLWLGQHLAKPGFDTGSSRMPNFGLSKDEIERLTEYLQGL